MTNLPSRVPFNNCIKSSSTPYSCPSSFSGPKKSPMHRTRSNLPCFASIAWILAKSSRMAPAADPTVSLAKNGSQHTATTLRAHCTHTLTFPGVDMRVLVKARLAEHAVMRALFGVSFPASAGNHELLCACRRALDAFLFDNQHHPPRPHGFFQQGKGSSG